MTVNYDGIADDNALAAIAAQVDLAKATDPVDWSGLDALIDKLDGDGVLRPRPAPAPAPPPSTEPPITSQVVE